MTTLLLRILERVHGHLGWLSVAVCLFHPAIILRNPETAGATRSLSSDALYVLHRRFGRLHLSVVSGSAQAAHLYRGSDDRVALRAKGAPCRGRHWARVDRLRRALVVAAVCGRWHEGHRGATSSPCVHGVVCHRVDCGWPWGRGGVVQVVLSGKKREAEERLSAPVGKSGADGDRRSADGSRRLTTYTWLANVEQSALVEHPGTQTLSLALATQALGCPMKFPPPAPRLVHSEVFPSTPSCRRSRRCTEALVADNTTSSAWIAYARLAANRALRCDGRSRWCYRTR